MGFLLFENCHFNSWLRNSVISRFNVISYQVVSLATSHKYTWIIMANWTVIFGAGFAIVATFDVYWFLRLAYTRFLSFFRQPISITDVSSWVVNLRIPYALNELQKVFPWQFSYTAHSATFYVLYWGRHQLATSWYQISSFIW